jgi:hypothetical protein
MRTFTREAPTTCPQVARRPTRRCSGRGVREPGTGQRDEELQVQPPFAEARVWSHSLYVRLTAGTPLESVVRLPIAPLRGGMTLQEVRAVEAAPSSTRTDSLGTYWSFGHDALGIELAHLQYRDSGPVDKWVVRAAPKENTVRRSPIPRAGTSGFAGRRNHGTNHP